MGLLSVRRRWRLPHPDAGCRRRATLCDRSDGGRRVGGRWPRLGRDHPLALAGVRRHASQVRVAMAFSFRTTDQRSDVVVVEAVERPPQQLGGGDALRPCDRGVTSPRPVPRGRLAQGGCRVTASASAGTPAPARQPRHTSPGTPAPARTPLTVGGGGYRGSMITVDEYLAYCDRALDGLRRHRDELGDDLVNARLDGIPGSNSAFALVTHVAGMTARWVRTVNLGIVVPRDRAAEFTATGPSPRRSPSSRPTRARLHEDARAASPRALPADPADHDNDGSISYATQGEVLLHVYEELAQHLGQLEVTRDVLLAQRARNRLTVGALRQDDRVSETPTDPAARAAQRRRARRRPARVGDPRRGGAGSPVRLPRARRPDHQRRRVRPADAPAQRARGGPPRACAPPTAPPSRSAARSSPPTSPRSTTSSGCSASTTRSRPRRCSSGTRGSRVTRAVPSCTTCAS